MITASHVLAEVRCRGVSQAELAARSGVARETLSRWASGVQDPGLGTLARVVAAAGLELEVRVRPADEQLVEMVLSQRDLGPTDRLKTVVGDQWPACRSALRLAAAVGDVGVMIGPVAAALRGSPTPLPLPRVDLLVPEDDVEDARRRLRDGGAAAQADLELVEREQREVWSAGRGRLTVRSSTPGIDSSEAVRSRAHPVGLTQEDAGVVWVALVEDLLDIARASPWRDEADAIPGLRAVLTSGRYSIRRAPTERLDLGS
jgi:transcriptional regulator with XRE-family HTH domain